MFTSKKAQYLDNNFNKISPLTNIDSLYYEQAVANGNDISIYRRTFVKHMPVQFNKNFELIDTSAYTLESLSYNALQETNTSIYINAYIHTEDIKNPYDSDTNEYLYDTSLFKVIGEKYIDLHKALNHYEQLYYFNSSVNDISTKCDTLNASIANASNDMNDLYALIYNNAQADSSQNNDIYFIEYKPNPIDTNAFMYIQVQNISTNNIYEQISLDNASISNDDKKYVKDWIFHYNTSSNKITYLKDEYGNEGNFDFRNIVLQNNVLIGISEYTKNNKIYIDPQNSSILFNSLDNELKSNITIVNSTNIALTGTINNLEIYNSSAYTMIVNGGQNNKICNYQNSSIQLNNSDNNTIINCNNCSILIDGSNNHISNLSGVSLKLGSNNIIIGDGSTNAINFESSNSLNNMKLFLDDSIRMAYTCNLNNCATIFGSSTNNVNVYVKSINTLK